MYVESVCVVILIQINSLHGDATGDAMQRIIGEKRLCLTRFPDEIVRVGLPLLMVSPDPVRENARCRPESPGIPFLEFFPISVAERE